MKPLFAIIAVLVLTGAAVVLFDILGSESPDPDVSLQQPADRPAENVTGEESTRPRTPRHDPLPPPDPVLPEIAEETYEEEEGEPETGLYGRISTPSGSMMENAVVNLYRHGKKSSNLVPNLTRVRKAVLTNSEGYYEFTGLKGGGRYRVKVEAGAYASSFQDGVSTVTDQLIRVANIQLSRGISIHGIVKKHTGAALPDAVVQAIDLLHGQRVVRQLKTDTDGTYELVSLDPGIYEIAASSKGMMTARSPAIYATETGNKRRQDFSLEQGSLLRGVVRTPSGQPISGARVMATRFRGGSASTGQTITDEKGVFKIEGLGAGHYSIKISRHGFIPQARHMIEANTTNLKFALIQTAGITGFVLRPDGDPVKAFWILLWQANEKGAHTSTVGDLIKTSSSDGSFTIENIRPGKYRVQAFAKDLAPTFSPVADVNRLFIHGLKVRMKLGAQLVGSVVNASGQPIPDATVQLVKNNFAEGPFTNLLHDKFAKFNHVQTNDEGLFSKEGVANGVYQLLVSTEEHASTSIKDIRVSEKNSPVECEPIVLVEGAVLSGFVMKPNHTPAVGAQVTVALVDGTLVDQFTVSTDGSFRRKHLKPDTYRIVATARPVARQDAFSTLLESVRASQHAVEVTLLDGRSESVTILVNY